MSAEGADARRAVHPYRDRREALIARRRTLERELGDADRAVARRDRIARHLAVIDDELSSHEPPLAGSIALDTPCRARWDEMQGDDVVRRCDRCQRDVHDLSHMTREEIEGLFARATTSPYARLRRRPDGRIVSGECPIERPSAARRALRIATAGALFGVSAAGAAALTIPIVGAPPLPPIEASALPPAPTVDVARLASTPSDDDYGIGEPSPLAPPITRADLDHHIRWIAPQAWEIDRPIVDRVIAEFTTTHPRMRAIPHERAGRVVGVKIYGVRRGSMYDRLGLRNGDLVMDVNGIPVAAQDALFNNYRGAIGYPDALFVRLERAGEERVHVYRITP